MTLVIVLSLVFVLAITGTLVCILVARNKSFLDLPNERSSHSIPTPKSGGIGFILAYLVFALLLYANHSLSPEGLLVIFAGLILAITGFLDDIKNLGIKVRITAQLTGILIALYLIGVPKSLEFPGMVITASWLLAGITTIGFLWLINLVNFMDGIDGLAASETLFICFAVILLNNHSAAPALDLLALGYICCLSGFLIFNIPPAKIFMGDAGSNFTGYVIGILILISLQQTQMTPWTWCILLGVFIVDSTTTLMGRMWSGEVWYYAHRSHCYQRAAKRLNSHGLVDVVTLGINCLWLLPLAWLSMENVRSGFILTIVAWMPLILLVIFVARVPETARTEGTKNES